MSRRNTQLATIVAAIGALAALAVPTAVADAEISIDKITGPKAAKKGKTITYRVEVSNAGDVPSDGVAIAVSGGAKGEADSDTIAAGTVEVVAVKAKVTGKRGKTVTVRFKVTDADGTTASKTRKLKVKKRKKPAKLPSGLLPPPAPALPIVN